MTTLTKLLIAAGLVVVIGVAGYGIHHSIRESGRLAGRAELQKENDDARAEAGRKNKTIVKQDHEIIAAKTEDKEKIVTIYRTIREQLDAKIVEVPIYRECRLPADSMRLIQQAAAGDLRADTAVPASSAASDFAGTKE